MIFQKCVGTTVHNTVAVIPNKDKKYKSVNLPLFVTITITRKPLLKNLIDAGGAGDAYWTRLLIIIIRWSDPKMTHVRLLLTRNLPLQPRNNPYVASTAYTAHDDDCYSSGRPEKSKPGFLNLNEWYRVRYHQLLRVAIINNQRGVMKHQPRFLKNLLKITTRKNKKKKKKKNWNEMKWKYLLGAGSLKIQLNISKLLIYFKYIILNDHNRFSIGFSSFRVLFFFFHARRIFHPDSINFFFHPGPIFPPCDGLNP